ncbi:MAG TPA: hypothetical protein VFS40_08245 [Gemmatimonadales bacterium]|nr:hypothetical protein [Gemmatimonadales bacterium]
MRRCDRRDFLRLAAGAAADAGALLAARAPLLRALEVPAPPAPTLRLGFVPAHAGGAAADAVVEAARRGVELGAAEAEQSARLLGRAVAWRTLADVAAARTAVAAREVDVLLGGFDAATCLALADAAAAAGVPFFNLGCRADALRNADCRRHAFHVEASETMYRLALETAGNPPSGPTGAVRIVLWHPSLARFGADQLNDRYRARHGEGMPAAAWAGWMAAKVALEGWLRAGRTPLVDHLARPATQFDGHKGWPLSFRPWDHQLRQPLYAVLSAGGAARVERVTREVPAMGVAEAPSRELLDSIAGPASASACRWGAS